MPRRISGVIDTASEECHDLPLYVGEREGGEPADEAEHFYTCAACSQMVDMRDLAAVSHHEEPGHEPLPPEVTFRLVGTGEHRRRGN